MRLRAFLCASLLLVACGPKNEPTTPPEPAPGTDPGLPDSSDGGGESLTAADCEAQGGTVVGDIGDGAIHKPDYTCPDSGEPPLGTIEADPDGPIATEGAVCCV